MNKFFKAFTLAEVLITLSIIGIVAAMTLPTLVQKNQEKETIVQLKKAYSILSQAYYSAISEYGDSSEWDLGEVYSPEGAASIADKLVKYFKVHKICGTEPGCFPKVTYRGFNNSSWYYIYNTSRVYKLILADGTLIGFESHGNEYCKTSYCAKVFVDVNGYKGPNQLGYDTFSFYLQKGRIMPYGYQGDTVDPFDTSKIKTNIGEFLTAWVLVNENMDYKRCPEKLGWDKSSSCKD